MLRQSTDPLGTGILSDRQIAELCVCPTHKLDEVRYRKVMARGRSQTLVHYDDPEVYVQRDRDHAERVRRESMVLVNDAEREAFRPMIEPFSPELIRQIEIDETIHRKIISRGLSSYGYDISIREEMKIFSNASGQVVDPKRFDERCLVSAEVHTDPENGSRYVILPPNGYLLGSTVEYFRFPRDVTAIFIGKSTYARVGVFINITPGEAGWEGYLVLEVANLTGLPVRIYANEGISQALFFRGSEECCTSYEDRGGKYQRQQGLTLAKV